MGFPGGSAVKKPPAKARDTRHAGLISGSRRYPGEGNSNPLQYSCLENPIDRGDWQATVHGVTKSQTRLKRLSRHNNYSLKIREVQEGGDICIPVADSC